jgi:hypothetical protein
VSVRTATLLILVPSIMISAGNARDSCLSEWLYPAHYRRFDSLGCDQDVIDKVQRHLAHLGNLHHGVLEQAAHIRGSLAAGQQGGKGALYLTERSVLIMEFDASFAVGGHVDQVAHTVLKGGPLPVEEPLGAVEPLLINLETING